MNLRLVFLFLLHRHSQSEKSLPKGSGHWCVRVGISAELLSWTCRGHCGSARGSS